MFAIKSRAEASEPSCPLWLKLSEQPFLALQVAKRSYVGQRKSEAVLVLIADRTQREAPVFKVQAAAVPVVRGLGRRVLQQVEFAVKADVGGSAPASLGGAAIAKLGAQLVKQRRHARRLIENVRDACGKGRSR